ncbi:TetR/AcrR family transcriptional regulator C-terminal domain-containing protein [Paenibacillus endoradicis]|uniref:TetR/AcrR family transcriptional regulator C-terminal domain-containing protein n=1 Tax=Paenibacillus endoradicis TaxID=2972487 RepID=UPI002158BB41|nr:TetR/AcrR family transcriptional regulator C-terminal domain-containing protein [Paenibacillus endoradicis]MCR8660613.1 TetR/AcrR family transcriptional regulator C-terminal domain-containing protein [Paenibacillus endoradicis]
MKNEKFLDFRIVKSRRKIKNAMIQLMSINKYSNISIQDIVEEAALNRGTFYNHFLNKDELLAEILDEVVNELVNSYRVPYSHISTFKLNEIEPNTVILFQNVYKHKKFYQMIVHSEIIFKFQTKLTKEIKSLYLNELFLQNSKINPDINATYSAYAVVGTIINWVENDFIYTPEYMAKQLMEIVTMSPHQSLVAIKNK